VRARVLVDLGFRVGGKVIERPVNVADPVKAGDVLARLDPGDRRLAVEAAESVQAAAEAEAGNARTLFERYEGLGSRSSAFVPTEYEQRRAAMLSATARLEQAKRQLSMARAQLGYDVLAADADGVITALPVESGQVVTAGQTVASLALTNETEIVVDVPENRLAEVRDAQTIGITLWAAPEREIKGRLREIGALADPASRTFAAKISVLDPPAGLLNLGMTATVRFTGPNEAPVVILPASALVGSDGQASVWVLDEAAKRAAPRKVDVLRFGADGTVTIGGGLSAGEKVVTAGADLLDRDMPVTAWEGPVR
jgi:multidrug efflux system membrane fusion protein